MPLLTLLELSEVSAELVRSGGEPKISDFPAAFLWHSSLGESKDPGWYGGPCQGGFLLRWNAI